MLAKHARRVKPALQSMKVIWPIVAVVSAILALLTGVFAITLPSTVYLSSASGGDPTVKVQTSKCFVDCEVRVVARSVHGSFELDRDTDCIVTFAHAAWSGRTAAVYITTAFCKTFRIAYDFTLDDYVDWNSAKAWLAHSIKLEYQLKPKDLEPFDGDVFRFLEQLNQDSVQPWRGPSKFLKRIDNIRKSNSDPRLPLAVP